MTPEQLASIGPYFRDGQRYLNGTPIDWTTMNHDTMQALRQLRELLDAPITLIRGPHPDPTGQKPWKATAVDACAPSVGLDRVVMALCRIQRVSFGVYSGNSFHLDTRPFGATPARWMAIRPQEEPHLGERGLTQLVTNRVDGWTHLSWSHARGFEGLQLVIGLAKRQAGSAVDI